MSIEERAARMRGQRQEQRERLERLCADRLTAQAAVDMLAAANSYGLTIPERVAMEVEFAKAQRHLDFVTRTYNATMQEYLDPVIG